MATSSESESGSVVSDSLWPCGLKHTRLPLSFTISWSLLKLVSIESVMPSYHLILCCPLLLWPSMFPSIRVFSNESALHITWSKYWSFSLSISPSNKYSGLISFSSGLTGWISLLSRGLWRVSSNTTVQKHQFFCHSLLYGPTLTFIHDYWKNHSFDYTDLCQQSNVSFLVCCLGLS